MAQSLHPSTSLAPTPISSEMDPGRSRRRHAAAWVQAVLYLVAATVGWVALPHTAVKVAFAGLCAAVVVVLLVIPSGRFDDKLGR